MSDVPYNTNLASEFHVLSVLHRLGIEAMLTLGNKKSVDILIARKDGSLVTIDVKGLAGSTSWPVDNLKKSAANHFLVFVCYVGHIHDPSYAPEIWVIPSDRVEPFVYNSPKSRRVVQLTRLRKQAAEFKDAWSQLANVIH